MLRYSAALIEIDDEDLIPCPVANRLRRPQAQPRRRPDRGGRGPAPLPAARSRAGGRPDTMRRLRAERVWAGLPAAQRLDRLRRLSTDRVWARWVESHIDRVHHECGARLPAEWGCCTQDRARDVTHLFRLASRLLLQFRELVEGEVQRSADLDDL